MKLRGESEPGSGGQPGSSEPEEPDGSAPHAGALGEPHGQVRAFIETAHDAFVAIDADSIIREWNPQAEATFGWTREEALGRSMPALIMPERYRAAHIGGMKRYLDTGTRVLTQRVELPALHREGYEFPIELSLWSTGSGDALRCNAFIHDITGRHRAQQRAAVQAAVSAILLEADDLAAAGVSTLRAICDALEWQAGSLWMEEPGAGVLRCVEFWSDPAAGDVGMFEQETRRLALAPEQGLPGLVWSRKAPEWLPDLALADNFPRAAVALRAGLASGLAFPILGDHRVLGVFEFFSRRIERPDAELLATLAMLGRLLGQFIHRRQTECTLLGLIEAAPDAMVIVDTAGRIIRINDQTRRLFGYEAQELVGQAAECLLPAAVRDRHRGHLQRYFANPQVRKMGGGLELRGRRKDGSEFPVEIALSPLQSPRGLLSSAAIRDVSGRHRAEMVLQESRRDLDEAQQIAHIGSWSWDPASGRVEWSDEMYRLYGLERGNWTPTVEASLGYVHPEDQARVQDLVAAAMAGDGSLDYEHRIVRPDGEVRTLYARGRSIRDAAGNTIRMVGTGQDITERKRAQARLEELARFDPLTGLPNRRHFLECLNASLRQAKANGWLVAVLYLDLDGFKHINDTLGHAAGDELLQAVATRLVTKLRSRDTIGRLGGDEFAVSLVATRDAEAAAQVARKLNECLRAPFLLYGREIRIGASIGITVYPDDAGDVDTLLRFADTAMYAAKHSGRDAYRFYTADMNLRAQRRLELETALHRALERREFFLEYQPKIDLASGRWTGVEALMRWQHPEQGRIPPGEFIPVLEESGLIVPVGEWLVDAVCAQLGEWRRQGIAIPGIALNVSARQLMRRGDNSPADASDQLGGGRPRTDGLLRCLKRAMRLHGIPPGVLELELTESVLMGRDTDVVAMLDEIKALGIRLAIDDFGTGYSSLAYLKRFPIDALKIDGSFVRDIATDPDDAAITSAIVTMAHSLGLEAIAECVETQEQLDFLRAKGCDQAQGYYFARPLGPAALVDAFHGTGGHAPGLGPAEPAPSPGRCSP